MNVQPTAFTSTATITRPANTTAYAALDVIGVDAGTPQVETATANGTITAGVLQVETATAVGTITAGTAQVETATIVGTISTSGNATVTVTGAQLAGSPLATSVAVTAGTLQVETTTVVGTVGPAGAGNASVIVTANGMTNSPKTVTVAVANNDTASQVAGKIRTALGLDADVSAWFTISGATDQVILTAKAAAANDATMNISVADGTSSGVGSVPTSVNTTAGVAADDASGVAGKIRTALGAVSAITSVYTVSGATDKVILTSIAKLANDATLNIAFTNGTCVGLTPNATSANTTAGVANGAGNATVVVTSAHLENSPITLSVAVAAGDTASDWAGKVRVALAANENIDDAFTVSGATDQIILTAKSKYANDATLNISLDNGTCTGITTAASSANTTAGVASGAGNATVVVTGARIFQSPITLSVAVADGDTAATWAGKVRTALNADTRITNVYTVGGASTSITLTETATSPSMANDATLNISLDNGTCTGIVTAASSANTTAGSASSTNAGSAILTFANAGPKSGSVYITDCNLQVRVGSVPSGMSTFRLHLYNAAPDAILDNAAWDLSSAGDLSKYLGYIDLQTPADVGSTLLSQNYAINRLVHLAPESNALYGVLQTIGGYTPSSGTVKFLEIQAVAA